VEIQPSGNKEKDLGGGGFPVKGVPQGVVSGTVQNQWGQTKFLGGGFLF